jgi:transposase-like protein
MGKVTRRKFTAEFKTKVVLETLKEQLTLAELSKKYGVSGVMISRWKSEFIEHSSLVFSRDKQGQQETEKVNTDKLFDTLNSIAVQ